MYNLYNAGHTLRNKFFYCSKTDSDVFIFEYVLKGKGSIICDNKLYSVEENDFYIVPNHKTYEYFTDADDPYERLWFYGEGKFFESLYSLMFKNENVVIAKMDCKEIYSKLFAMFSEDNCTDRNQLSLALTELFLMAKENLTNCLQLNNAKSMNKSSNIKNYICTHYYEKFDLAKIATKFGMTKNQIIIEFKRAYGTTPYVFSIMHKLDMAEEMLKRGLTNKEIAEHLSFCDEKHLSRLYIKHKKTYPKLVKRKN